MISTVLMLISIGRDCRRVQGMCIRSSLMKPLQERYNIDIVERGAYIVGNISRAPIMIE